MAVILPSIESHFQRSLLDTTERGWLDGRLYEGRLINQNQGTYQGYPLEEVETPVDRDGLLSCVGVRLGIRVSTQTPVPSTPCALPCYRWIRRRTRQACPHPCRQGSAARRLTGITSGEVSRWKAKVPGEQDTAAWESWRLESSPVGCLHGARIIVGWDSVPTGSGRRPNLRWLRPEAALGERLGQRLG